MSLTLVVLCATQVVVAAIIAAWSYRRRSSVRAASAFATMIALEGLWSLGHLGETLSTTLDGKIAFDALQNLPPAGFGVASLWLAYDYVGARRGRTTMLVLGVLSGVCALVLASPALHLYRHPNVHLVGDPAMLAYDFGVWDFALAALALGSSVVAAIIVLRRFVGENALYAAQSAALSIALALPAIGTLFVMGMNVTIDGDRDITPITFTAAALIAAWGLRRRLFDLAPIARDAVLARLRDPVMVVDRELRLVDVNPAAATLIGEPVSELLGRAPDDVLRRFPALVTLLASGSDDEVEIVDDDRWYAAVSSRLEDDRGRPIGRALMLREITARKRLNVELEASVEARTAELAVSEKRFRAMFDEMVSLVGLLDRDGRVRAANRASLEMIGMHEDALRGLHFWDTPWWSHSPAVQAQIRDAIMRAAAGAFVRLQTHHVDRDGKRHDIDFSLTPVRDAQGEVIELIPEGRDVTALHEERARAERLSEQLRQGQKLESIGRLAGGIAHDFNNLLTVIKINTEELRSAHEPGSNHSVSVEEIGEAADAAAQITRQLLTFSRSQPAALQPTTMSDALAPSQRLLGRLLRADIALRFDIGPELWVRADPTQLQQVVMNLALNAQDAMPGGGRLSIAIDQVTLDETACAEIAGAQPGRHARLTCTDTGTGMDAATRARVFEPFYTTKPEGKGTGLGLAVVYGVVYQSGGAIEVTSRPGDGTTFTLYFPRVDPPHATATEQAPQRTPIAATRTIVLVEDQEAVRHALSRHLKRCGYHLHVFSTPGELRARASALDPRPDLLLSDVVLPEMNGVELARAVVPLWPGVRVLFMSGYTADVSVTAMQSVTEDTLISKPFRPAELVERIERVLASAPAWE